MIGQIARSYDFDKNLIVNSNTKNYNSNFSESVIKNVNYEFGDIFSDLTTISNYRTGNLNYIALSGKENSDEINGTIINFTLPENFKEINSIKLIIAINDFEVYTSNISDSVFSKCEILPNTQTGGDIKRLDEQDTDDGDYGIFSSGMYIHFSNQDGDYIKNYRNISTINNGYVEFGTGIWINNNQLKTNTTKTASTGILQTPNNFRTFPISNIEWHTPDPDYYMQQEKYLGGHCHDFQFLANMLDGFDHCHSIISNNHLHTYSFPKHIHFADTNHRHPIIFTSHLHQINTTHNHNIYGENLFYKNFNANSINIKEINKNYNINNNSEIDLTNYKSNISNKITIIPNAKCNLTYFILIEMYCIEDE